MDVENVVCKFAPNTIKSCKECPHKDCCSILEALIEYWEDAMGDDL